MSTSQVQADSKGVLGYTVNGNDGKPVALSQYAGKVLLIVNTASKCGYTPQYKDLQALYEKYQAKGFVVLAFPANDFGKQEPGTDAEIKKFCELNYFTKFPLFSKVVVKGPEKAELFKYLTEGSDSKFKGEIDWNFEKFLIDKKGQVAARYKSKVAPTDPQVEKKIESLL